MSQAVVLPWFGGKAKYADWIVDHLPPHQTYVEPFGGAMAVLLEKTPSPVEVYNDIDAGLVGFWRVVRDPDLCERLQARLQLTPYSRSEWRWSRETWRDATDPVERAARWWTWIRQTFSASTEHSGWSYTTEWSARGASREVSKWIAAIDESLLLVHRRIRGVQVEGLDWRTIFDRYDGPQTLFYCDPPYVPASRRSGKYAHELDAEDHLELVDRLLSLQGAAVLSGYPNDLYRSLEAAGWATATREVTCHSVGRTRATGLKGPGSMRGQVRTECLWIKPSVSRPRLFAAGGGA